jgi:LysR family transcriptional regulator, hypochlorite-specific transcription factor HypT
MNVKWLEDFLALCETRSFTTAARRRFLTQSALSKHLQALETWLGAETLLDRSTNPLRITSAGLSFRETASQIVALLNAARLAVAHDGRFDGLFYRPGRSAKNAPPGSHRPRA